MQEHRRKSRAVFFIDPPYTAAGKKAGRRLYRHNELDHGALFVLASRMAGDVLLTYDDASGVRELAASVEFEVESVAMQNTHLKKMTELVIARDLTWMRS